jgi:predicted TIM-barrel fold metal-dependent hydrolase
VTVLGVRETPPTFDVPKGACDCHVHVFGPPERFPWAPERTYTPGAAPVAALLTLQEALRLDRVVVVQPTPYGSDNACLLDALAQLGRRARGVIVAGPMVRESDLRRMHEMGVRGVRVNLETRGLRDPLAARAQLEEAAGLAALLGWHVEIYTNLSVIGALAEVLLSFPATIVIDHFGRAEAPRGIHQEGFDVLRQLLRTGRFYVKLSAPYYISQLPDYEDVDAIARALIVANPERVVWGTNWPHPGGRSGPERRPDRLEPFRPEDDGAALNRLARWAGDGTQLHRILVENPARLYGFP